MDSKGFGCAGGLKRGFFRVLLSVMYVSVSVLSASNGLAQPQLMLPLVGIDIPSNVTSTPVQLQALQIYPDQPMQLGFIVTSQFDDLPSAEIEAAASTLIRYFMAALTVPEDEIWVNLAPDEPERMMTTDLAATDLGQDLLALDYLLKQHVAQLMSPTTNVGQTLWQRIYMRLYEEHGITDIPVTALNKVWIVPDRAEVYVNDKMALLGQSRLAVQLDGDDHRPGRSVEVSSVPGDMVRHVMHELVLPEIERHINSHDHFSRLRDIYHAIILATWYKMQLNESTLGRYYADQAIIGGIESEFVNRNQETFERYLQSFAGPAGGRVAERYDPQQQRWVNQKYITGGVTKFMMSDIIEVLPLPLEIQSQMAAASAPMATNVVVQFEDDSPPLPQSTSIWERFVRPVLAVAGMALSFFMMLPGQGNVWSPAQAVDFSWDPVTETLNAEVAPGDTGSEFFNTIQQQIQTLNQNRTGDQRLVEPTNIATYAQGALNENLIFPGDVIPIQNQAVSGETADPELIASLTGFDLATHRQLLSWQTELDAMTEQLEQFDDVVDGENQQDRLREALAGIESQLSELAEDDEWQAEYNQLTDRLADLKVKLETASFEPAQDTRPFWRDLMPFGLVSLLSVFAVWGYIFSVWGPFQRRLAKEVRSLMPLPPAQMLLVEPPPDVGGIDYSDASVNYPGNNRSNRSLILFNEPKISNSGFSIQNPGKNIPLRLAFPADEANQLLTAPESKVEYSSASVDQITSSKSLVKVKPTPKITSVQTVQRDILQHWIQRHLTKHIQEQIYDVNLIQIYMEEWTDEMIRVLAKTLNETLGMDLETQGDADKMRLWFLVVSALKFSQKELLSTWRQDIYQAISVIVRDVLDAYDMEDRRAQILLKEQIGNFLNSLRQRSHQQLAAALDLEDIRRIVAGVVENFQFTAKGTLSGESIQTAIERYAAQQDILFSDLQQQTSSDNSALNIVFLVPEPQRLFFQNYISDWQHIWPDLRVAIVSRIEALEQIAADNQITEETLLLVVDEGSVPTAFIDVLKTQYPGQWLTIRPDDGLGQTQPIWAHMETALKLESKTSSPLLTQLTAVALRDALLRQSQILSDQFGITLFGFTDNRFDDGGDALPDILEDIQGMVEIVASFFNDQPLWLRLWSVEVVLRIFLTTAKGMLIGFSFLNVFVKVTLGISNRQPSDTRGHKSSVFLTWVQLRLSISTTLIEMMLTTPPSDLPLEDEDKNANQSPAAGQPRTTQRILEKLLLRPQTQQKYGGIDLRSQQFVDKLQVYGATALEPTPAAPESPVRFERLNYSIMEIISVAIPMVPLR